MKPSTAHNVAQQAQLDKTLAQPYTPSSRRRHPKIAKRPTLNRSNIAADVAAVLKISANKSRQVLDAVLEAVKLRVQQGHAVELRGFARFEVRNVKARSRVDMKDVKSGKKGRDVGRIEVPAHAVVKATASPVFLGGAGGAKAPRSCK